MQGLQCCNIQLSKSLMPCAKGGPLGQLGEIENFLKLNELGQRLEDGPPRMIAHGVDAMGED